MILEFTVFYFMFWWVMSILYKDNLIHRLLEKTGQRLGQATLIGKFFDSLSQCKFCIENHTATTLAIGYAYYCQDIKILIWGFLCASINSWIRTFLK